MRYNIRTIRARFITSFFYIYRLHAMKSVSASGSGYMANGTLSLSICSRAVWQNGMMIPIVNEFSLAEAKDVEE